MTEEAWTAGFKAGVEYSSGIECIKSRIRPPPPEHSWQPIATTDVPEKKQLAFFHREGWQAVFTPDVYDPYREVLLDHSTELLRQGFTHWREPFPPPEDK